MGQFSSPDINKSKVDSFSREMLMNHIKINHKLNTNISMIVIIANVYNELFCFFITASKARDDCEVTDSLF